MKNKLTLTPGDFLQLKSGLKIENVGKDVIEFPMPEEMATYPLKNIEKNDRINKSLIGC